MKDEEFNRDLNQFVKMISKYDDYFGGQRQKSKLDASYVATAALAGVEYLLTQNCRHIANARVLPSVYRLLAELGLPPLLICTPIEFLGDDDDHP